MTTAPASSPWPAEDGGPERQQRVPGQLLGADSGQRLQVHSRRTWLSTMTVLGAPGEVYLLTHSALRARIGLPTTAQVERIHPETLETLECSPRLPGGPMWPGGMALHPGGDLHLVYGNHAHRLDRHCQPLASRQLPGQDPYNGFVTLPGGQLVAALPGALRPGDVLLDGRVGQPVPEAVPAHALRQARRGPRAGRAVARRAKGGGMKGVELYRQVRHSVRIEGLSRRETARRFGIGRLVETSPATAKPVSLIGLIGFSCLEFLFKHLREAHGEGDAVFRDEHGR